MEREQWGRRIRAFRKLKGFTQERFAEVMDMSVSILGEIERGNRVPTKEQLEIMTDTLNISMEDLSPMQPILKK